MGVSMVGTDYLNASFYGDTKRTAKTETSDFAGAFEKAAKAPAAKNDKRIVSAEEWKKEQGESIGFTFDYGDNTSSYAMVASMNADSTQSRPLVDISVQNSDGTYTVRTIDINKVNVRNASEAEMFALCSYNDATGNKVEGATFGSWKAFRNTVLSSGAGEKLMSFDRDSFENVRMNWMELEAEAVMNLFGAHADREHRMARGVLTMLSAYASPANEVRSTSFMSQNQITDAETNELVANGYIDKTYYSRDGIVSERSGYGYSEKGLKDEFKWKVDFNSDDDYERVMKFLDRIPQGDNTVFATRQDFWQDFMNGDIDEDEFMEFYDTLDHGTANFIKQDADGNSYIDREMLGSKFYKYFGPVQLKETPAITLADMMFM